MKYTFLLGLRRLDKGNADSGKHCSLPDPFHNLANMAVRMKDLLTDDKQSEMLAQKW